MLTLLASALLLAPPPAVDAQDEPRPYLEAAREVGSWLVAHALETEHGLVWPIAPDESDAVDLDLYAGTPGVVLFLLELGRVAGDAQVLAAAWRGADHLAATLPEAIEPTQAGLYTGVAGRGFVLLEAFRSSGRQEHRLAAERCADLLHAAAVETGHGVRWGEVTDVISGAAGTGLFLLDSARRLERPQDLELAARAGRHLLALARPEEVGRSWAMDPGFPRVMPNFSHGTAGVAFFLTSLHAATGDEAFLEAAIDGARYLESIADTSDGGFRIYHDEPDGTDLFYLGWCHGPPGTARLFERLAQVTDDATWRTRARQALHTLHESGLPAARPPGLWDNVSVCCGTAGIGDFALAQGDLPFARTLADDLLTRARRTEAGLCWPQAEHRTRPDLIRAQTGLMQGAAGVGLFLLRLDAGMDEDRGRIRMPDDPF